MVFDVIMPYEFIIVGDDHVFQVRRCRLTPRWPLLFVLGSSA
jgi:hypothetical protein